MRCPFCGDSSTSLIDSRLSTDTNSIRRRRECVKCNKRFSTLETSELAFPRVIKSDGTTELFSKNKIKDGVLLALEKRPNSQDEIEKTLDNIYNLCLTNSDKEISTTHIGKYVMEELIKLDHVAYIRFASVYFNFNDMESFKQLIKTLDNNLSPEMKKRQSDLLKDE